MALDGAFLSCVRMELEQAIGARVDKIAQPSREEILIHLRIRGGGKKILLNANASAPRVHFTEESPENPKSPPMFCMLLRKHLAGAKLEAVRQMELERILQLVFDATNELGDRVQITIVCEIMGRHSNIIVVGPDNRIIDSIKRVGLEVSSVRQVLPGITYSLPPQQNKISICKATIKEIMERVSASRDVDLSKALLETLQGASPLLCREIAYYTTRGAEKIRSSLTEEEKERLKFYLSRLQKMLQTGEYVPTMIQEISGRPRDYSFLPIHQYGSSMLTKEYESCSALLDAFYRQRDEMERIKQRAGDLLKLLANTSDRIARKLNAQREELTECANRDAYKKIGDLIHANLHAIQKGSTLARVIDYYDAEAKEIEVKLDARKTPVQNAQHYYALYRKADTAEKILTKQIQNGEEELIYIDSVFDALTRAQTEAELDSIRRELAEGGYIRRAGSKNKKEQKLAPLKYISQDGFTILTGRNNVQNDRLTLKESRNTDIWLHTQKIPGSHTIIVTEGREVPQTTIEEACIIAAYNSKARNSTKVPVDYTLVKHVKKPSGAKPGMVIYDHYQTVIVNPDEEIVRSLHIDKGR